jgi:N-acetylmuramoyl-L-alanine amidase
MAGRRARPSSGRGRVDLARLPPLLALEHLDRGPYGRFMRAYVVQQGDHLAGIAARLGFDAETCWNDEQNRELREQRGDPQVLAAGDVLYVPEPEGRGVSIRPRATNRYSARPPKVRVRVRMRTAEGALANAECRIVGDGPPRTATTDGDGNLELEVAATAREVRVQASGRRVDAVLRIGHLDPLDQDSGVVQRLTNLGYLAPIEEYRYADDDGTHTSADGRRRRVAFALAAFQRDRGIEQTGAADDATRDALREAHGA